jgi:hypothetical protein
VFPWPAGLERLVSYRKKRERDSSGTNSSLRQHGTRARSRRPMRDKNKYESYLDKRNDNVLSGES